MSPPSKPRAPSASEPAGNLAVQLPTPEPSESPPQPSESPPADAPVAQPPAEDPIAAGTLAYTDATADQQEHSRNELQDRLTAYLTKARARVILTDNLHTMLSIKRGQGVLTFRMHHMFVGAPSVVVRAVARYAQSQDRDSANLLRDYVDANEPLIRRREQPRPITLDVEGRYHNLQQVFDELNDEYFDGAIEARITWGPRARRKRSRDSIKLGSYTVEDQLIRIHPVLDAADVPYFFVAWIVYHEMLHEVHDMPVVDGRRVYHTREFRRAEAQFDRYAEAVMWEKANLHKLLER
ncbi:MAG: hypothetical protein K0V04_00645 [Deltaproteobacteria bacterium]|nr:hypothetical protein [Deltaproteobacteria bacterium]